MDVVIREYLVIGEETDDDYVRWRFQDLSHVPRGVHITGNPAPDARLGIIHNDMALLSDRIDRIESRMRRVETRLNLTDAG
jgi:hypothetical protein